MKIQIFKLKGLFTAKNEPLMDKIFFYRKPNEYCKLIGLLSLFAIQITTYLND